MRKRDELADPNSCLNKAGDNAMLFVLKEGDEAMPSTIRYWIRDRLRLGCDVPGAPRLVGAEAIASAVEV